MQALYQVLWQGVEQCLAALGKGSQPQAAVLNAAEPPVEALNSCQPRDELNLFNLKAECRQAEMRRCRDLDQERRLNPPP